MVTVISSELTPDHVLSFEINPGTLLQFLETRAEGGPRLKCFEGSVTLVSPGKSHEQDLDRLSSLVLGMCWGLEIEPTPFRSTTWTLPAGLEDTAYEADAAYSIQSSGRAEENQPPDLAIEVVVSHPATKALRAGASLMIPELWVFDVPRRRLTFYLLATKGKHQGTYQPAPQSRAFPTLTAAEALELLDGPEAGPIAFMITCRDWTRRVLVPRIRLENGGA
jgi:Uma2 family endonuclease